MLPAQTTPTSADDHPSTTQCLGDVSNTTFQRMVKDRSHAATSKLVKSLTSIADFRGNMGLGSSLVLIGHRMLKANIPIYKVLVDQKAS
jgi:hypothetical protein